MKTKVNEDGMVYYPIYATRMNGIVHIYPELMGEQEFEMLAKEIKRFHETFWTYGGEVDWTDVLDNKDIEDTEKTFFDSANFIHPVTDEELQFMFGRSE